MRVSFGVNIGENFSIVSDFAATSRSSVSSRTVDRIGVGFFALAEIPLHSTPSDAIAARWFDDDVYELSRA